MALIDQLRRFLVDQVEAKRPEIDRAIAECLAAHKDRLHAIRYDIVSGSDEEVNLNLRITVYADVRLKFGAGPGDALDSGYAELFRFARDIKETVAAAVALPWLNIYHYVRTSAEVQKSTDRKEWEMLP